MWIMHLHNYGKMSLRSCRHSVSSLYLVLGLSGRVPSHESIRTWLCKHGYYRVKQAQKSGQIDDDFLLCSSDIIESFFGKFKQKICPNSSHKLTEFIFTIANFSKKFSSEEVQKALEFIEIKNLKELKNLKKILLYEIWCLKLMLDSHLSSWNPRFQSRD